MLEVRIFDKDGLVLHFYADDFGIEGRTIHLFRIERMTYTINENVIKLGKSDRLAVREV